MRKSLIFVLVPSFLISFSTFAQEKNIQFHSVNSFGLIGGESSPGIALQSINGIQFSNWYTGVGIGIDNYRYKTLPLFIDVRRFIDARKEAFLYADLGYNFPMKNKPGKEVSYYNSFHFTGGIYTDVGIGYKFAFIKKTSFFISMGYSLKKMENKTGITTCPFIGPCYVDYNNYKLSLGRIIFKSGFIF